MVLATTKGLKMKLLSAIFVLFIMKVVESNQRFQDNYIEDDKVTPAFLTLGQKYSIAIGSTVVLPCKINDTERTSHYVLAWKRDIAVLTAGDVKVTMNPRIRLMPPQAITEINEPRSSSYNLEIQNVRINDAGAYACQIGTIVPKEIVHNLEVLVPPKIDYLAPSTKVEVSKGASIKLECRATGNPVPKIVWSRKNNVMPNGEANITNSILEMMHADRHTVGHYKCTADNRVGQPDMRDIFVNVLYAPEIEVERPFVHTGVGYEAQLICIVHAEPPPQIIWYKESTQLGTTEQHSQQSRGNRHALIIRNVSSSDLGNYTCQASNHYGKDRASLTLSGIPSICDFDSPTLSNYRDQYNISWNVQSYAPILEYRLFFRKQSVNSEVIHHDKYPNNHNNYLMPSHLHSPLPVASFMNHDRTPEWENIVIPQLYHAFNPHHSSNSNSMMSTSNNNHIGGIGMGGQGSSGVTSNTNLHHHNPYHQNFNNRHRMSYLIKNLTPASNYEARVQARNDHGWNKLSSTFHFSTRAEDAEMEPSAQPAVLKTAGVLDKDAFSSSPAQHQHHRHHIISLTTNLVILVYILNCILCL